MAAHAATSHRPHARDRSPSSVGVIAAVVVAPLAGPRGRPARRLGGRVRHERHLDPAAGVADGCRADPRARDRRGPRTRRPRGSSRWSGASPASAPSPSSCIQTRRGGRVRVVSARRHRRRRRRGIVGAHPARLHAADRRCLLRRPGRRHRLPPDRRPDVHRLRVRRVRPRHDLPGGRHRPRARTSCGASCSRRPCSPTSSAPSSSPRSSTSSPASAERRPGRAAPRSDPASPALIRLAALS